MSRESALARGRLAAELSMQDACTITRSSGEVTDPDSGDVSGSTSTVYTGKCRVQQHQATADRQDVGEDNLLLLRLEVQLPIVGSEGLEVGDEVTITASANDADLVGRVFAIHDLAHKSEATARRVQCTERTG